ncbi:MAG: hypothetical protein A2162_03555 [Deltaproteobacteria bacterium RBG_13_52_11b]|nr:MAG: hypothetical protein A2162_03555 [Deltaproteobacteria bacterium RBG_13_52_11b]
MMKPRTPYMSLKLSPPLMSPTTSAFDIALKAEFDPIILARTKGKYLWMMDKRKIHKRCSPRRARGDIR